MPDTTMQRKSSTQMAMLLGYLAASARLAVLLPVAGAPTIRNIGGMALSCAFTRWGNKATALRYTMVPNIL